MFRVIFRRGVSTCLLFLVLAPAALGAVRDREVVPPSDGIIDRVVRFLKHLPRPLRPSIFDDVVTPPKP